MKVKRINRAQKVQAELEAIQNEAKQLSGYAGSDYKYAGNDDEGFDDDGEEGFAAKGKMAAPRGANGASKNPPALKFKFKLTNIGSAAVVRRLAILAAEHDTEAEVNAQGYNIAGIFKDGQVVPGATVGTNDVVLTSLDNMTWKMLIKYIKKNPSRLISMTWNSTNTDQYETQIVNQVENPFGKEGSTKIDISEYYSPDQYSAKKAEINLIARNEDFNFDDQLVSVMTLEPGTSMTITLRFSASHNTAREFDKAGKAGRNDLNAQKIAMGSTVATRLVGK